MAIVLCPECQKEISEKAVTCPHCGYPLKPSAPNHSSVQAPVVQKRKIPGRGFGITSMVLGIISIVYVPFLVGKLLQIPAQILLEFEATPFELLLVISVLSVPALVFGVLSLCRKYKGPAWAGTILSSISLLSCILALVFMVI